LENLVKLGSLVNPGLFESGIVFGDMMARVIQPYNIRQKAHIFRDVIYKKFVSKMMDISFRYKTYKECFVQI
jgi:hypothetical protein